MTRKAAMANLVLLFEEEENEEQSSAVEATCKKFLLQGRGNKDVLHKILQ